MELESFFPSRDRFALALRLNHLLAAPGFAAWLEGESLDVDRLLYGPDGKPRLSIFTLGHLSDGERMFFLALLLSQVVAWMRSRPGTGSLRALLAIDEVLGYLPPVAEPPSKKPLLTLLKQARAFGLGLVLATQNPADVDYKALSNLGTWFLGRLQTERDRERVLDGLLSAAGGLDRGQIAAILSGLESRAFLLHDVHRDGPVVFKTRWTLSYLKGPLTRPEITRLAQPSAVTAAPALDPAAPPRPAATAGAGPRPVLPAEVPQRFVPGPGGGVLEPWLLGHGRVAYRDPRRGVEADEELWLVCPFGAEPAPDWSTAAVVLDGPPELAVAPPEGCSFAPLPAAAARPATYGRAERDLAETLYRTRRLRLWKSPLLGELSHPGESERDFRIRRADRAREQRDAAVEKLRATFQDRLARLDERRRRAQERVEREEDQARQQKIEGWLSVGAALSSFLGGGRRPSARGASSALRGLTRSAKESRDVARAEEELAAIQEEGEALRSRLEEEVEALRDRYDPERETLEEVAVAPRKSDVDVRQVVLLWAPAESF
jgi:hypothetical protein